METYTWKTGFPAGKVDPQKAGQFLEDLRVKCGGTMEAEQIVAAAQSKRCPIHPLFQWDDTKAAALYREEQARYMIRAIEVVYEDMPDQPPIRAFVHLDDSGYESQREILVDVVKCDRQIQLAKAAAASWIKRYGQIEAMRELASLMERVLQPT